MTTGRPHARQQADGDQKDYSLAARIDCSDRPDMARQEDLPATDINRLMRQFGVTGQLPAMRTPISGTEIDYDLDLQQAFDAVHQAKLAWRDLPDELRHRYPTWVKLLEAIETGDLKVELTDPKPVSTKEESTPPPEPPQ